MGLDQYLNKVKENDNKTYVEGACGGLFGVGIKQKGEQLGYWRKDYSLDEVIREKILEEKYIRLNLPYEDVDPCPNCQPVNLSKEILQELIDHYNSRIEDIKDGDWDEQLDYYTPEEVIMEYEENINIFTKALSAIKEGYTISYMVWY